MPRTAPCARACSVRRPPSRRAGRRTTRAPSRRSSRFASGRPSCWGTSHTPISPSPTRWRRRRRSTACCRTSWPQVSRRRNRTSSNYRRLPRRTSITRRCARGTGRSLCRSCRSTGMASTRRPCARTSRTRRSSRAFSSCATASSTCGSSLWRPGRRPWRPRSGTRRCSSSGFPGAAMWPVTSSSIHTSVRVRRGQAPGCSRCCRGGAPAAR
mmetsp:Transcript_39132/g.112512  ORF Transcript_39132/g.112512 Transcript_39132/m.112512 type:complete len:212 (-) Transcript_39132:636-1271(-)